MNRILLLLIVLITSCESGDNKTKKITEKEAVELRTQKLNATEVYFNSSEKIQNSDFYIYPVSSSQDEIDKSYYSKGSFESRTWNMVFYNIKTGHQHLLIDDKIPVIENYPSESDFQYLEEFEVEIEKNQRRRDDKLFFEIRMNDFNKDGIIDKYDPNGLFVCDLNGSNLKRISPKGLELTTWKFLDSEKKLIEIRCLADKNNDNIFNSKDEQKIFITNLDSLQKGCVEIFGESFKQKLKENYIDKK